MSPVKAFSVAKIVSLNLVLVLTDSSLELTLEILTVMDGCIMTAKLLEDIAAFSMVEWCLEHWRWFNRSAWCEIERGGGRGTKDLVQ